MSIIITLAPNPAAIFAASVPTIPPPKIITFAGRTPGTPPSNIPLPPDGFSKYLAPSCTAILPATSDIGTSNGRLRSDFSTVSYARHMALLLIIASVNGSYDAK